MESLNDERELILAVLRKDRKATACFVQAYADAVYSYVSRRLAPRHDLVDDVVQEVFLDAWEGLSRFRGESGVRAWLLGIARHKVQDHYRARLRSFLPLVDGDDAGPGFAGRFEQVQEAQRVRAALERLPEVYRLVLLWRYWEKLSTAEMARQIGKTEKAVERVLARAREQFRRFYDQ